MSNAKFAHNIAALRSHHQTLAQTRIDGLFQGDIRRFADFHLTLDDLVFDFSKHGVTRQTLALLVQLAENSGVEAARQKLFSGAKINQTEQRPALHMALRDFTNASFDVDGHDILADVRSVRGKMLAFAEDVRSGRLRGATGLALTDIVNIGIGGSDLGPAMATRALSPFKAAHIRSHFVSNVDGADMADNLAGLDPAKTLFIVASKTFTTQETMTNAASARAWIVAGLGEKAVALHFAAVSTRLDKVAAFGIDPSRVFGFWDWVGGRYSLWSSIGLALAIAIGAEHFEAFLRGAESVDKHFALAPLARNIPVIMALLGVWYRNICGFATQAIIPYDQRLARFPAYLQQLDMESNGKSVLRDGEASAHQTGPVIWGEPGTNGQHAFFQLLHQGTSIVPVDFIIAAEPLAADEHHHDLLVANCLAQGQAFMQGRSLAEVEALLRRSGMDAAAIAALAPHKVFAGNKPSSTFLHKALTPFALGRLIALYEHKVFVQSVIWDINPFDQWGVELGKELAVSLAPVVADSGADLAGLDGSTAGLIKAMRRLRAA